MKKLFTVEITDTVYIMAEDAREAERLAHGVGIDLDPDYHAYKTKYPVCDWGDNYPYNRDKNDKRTVDEILDDQRKQVEKEAYLKEYAPELPFGEAV